MSKKGIKITNIFLIFLIAYSIMSIHLTFINENKLKIIVMTINLIQILIMLMFIFSDKIRIYWFIFSRFLDIVNIQINNSNIITTIINNLIIISVFYIFYKVEKEQIN